MERENRVNVELFTIVIAGLRISNPLDIQVEGRVYGDNPLRKLILNEDYRRAMEMDSLHVSI